MAFRQGSGPGGRFPYYTYYSGYPRHCQKAEIKSCASLNSNEHMRPLDQTEVNFTGESLDSGSPAGGGQCGGTGHQTPAMWESLQECAGGYTEFEEELVRRFIQKVTVENAETIRVHFRDSDVVLEQGLQ